MVTATRRLTYDDRERIPQERAGDRHELIGGVLYVTASPIPLHEFASTNFVFALERVIRPRRLGRVLTAPVDVYFTPEDVVIPDISFVSRERLHIVGEKRIDGAPDLIVEILSPSTRQQDQGLKKALYARHGVREYWLLDPVPRSVNIWLLDGAEFVPVPIHEETARSRIIPDFSVSLSDLFAID